ncbi:MAG: EamA family transporter [Chloroflexi bacterium]|nr:EamA family transporter [Ardenticatenaceae bacterium]MBL1130982.1 EamA family transporter [Chloroflexota bacterium]NOG37080.1 EamA family transporter [Chloroflexota bacterium]GIK58913.1 MAG: ABC transporter permease [Chloroflexota bacterium]
MNWKNLLLMILLAALWGPSFVFIKVGVETIPPLTLVFGRVALAAVLLYVVLRWQHGRLPDSRTIWKHIAVVALIHNAIPFFLFAWGEQYVDSALASILNGTIPLFTILLAHFFTQDDHLTPAKVIGVLVGFAGMLVLVYPAFQDGVVATAWGVLALVLASFLYGVAIVYGRNHLRGLPSLVAPTGQMMMASLYLLPLVLLERPWTLPAPSMPSILSMLALAVLGTALAFIVYYKLLERAGASYLSMVAYMIPVFGIFFGVILLDEQLTGEMILGGALILFGVMIVNGLFNAVFARRVPQQVGAGD